MRILVAYGPTCGSAAGIAELLAFALRAEGFEAHARPACEVDDLDDADAVVAGGPVCMGRWHGDARRFIRRHRAALTARPVWLFSCGSPEDCNPQDGVPLVTQVRVLMDRVHARGHAGIADHLSGVRQLPAATRAAQRQYDDWRDPEQVARFARQIAAELHRQQVQPS